MARKRIIVLALVLSAVPLAVNAAWERQYVCQQGSTFPTIGAFDEKHAAVSGGIDDGSGTKLVVVFSSNGKWWQQGSFAQVNQFSMPLYMSAPSKSAGFMLVYTPLAGKPYSRLDIEQSTSQGATFTLLKNQPSDSPGKMPMAIYFTDSLNGWVLGGADKAHWLIRTRDGGATWDNTLSLPYEENISYPSMFFINDKYGWLAGGDQGEWDDDTGEQTRTAGRGVIQYTTDGGKTWIKAVSEASWCFESITFTDCLNGWATATDNYTKARLFRTTDGGKTWTEAAFPQHTSKKDYTSITTVRFFDTQEGWAAAFIQSGDHKNPTFQTELLHTTDGGKTWKADTTYNDALKAVNDNACCYPADMCKNAIVLISAQYSGALAMTWPSRNVGWVAGSNAIIMKYTADTPSADPVHRCVACCGGKCPGDPDGGYSTSCGEADGGVQDAQIDSGASQDAAALDAASTDSGTGPDGGKDGGTKKDGGGEDSQGGCSCNTVGTPDIENGGSAPQAATFLLMLAFFYRKRIICRRKDQRNGTKCSRA